MMFPKVSDLGIGLVRADMQRCLRGWGYSVSREACTNWLQRYRMEVTAKRGTAALYKLALPDLQYWHHVEKLSPTELQTRYLL